MGHFSNGTMGEMYMDAYCFKCVNWKPMEPGNEESAGCFVMDAHMLYQNEGHDDLLNMFIPRVEGPEWNGECRMFIASQPTEKPDIFELVDETHGAEQTET